MAIAVTIPLIYTTYREKLCWLHKYKLELRVLFNRMGTWYRDGGVSLNQYNTLLPTKVKNRYAYVDKLSEADWLDFVNIYHKLVAIVGAQQGIHENASAADNTWDVDMNRDTELQ